MAIISKRLIWSCDWSWVHEIIDPPIPGELPNQSDWYLRITGEKEEGS